MLRTLVYAGVLVASSAACERAEVRAGHDREAGLARGAQRADVDAGLSAPAADGLDASAESLDLHDARAPEIAEPLAPPADGRPELWDQSIATACRSNRPLCPDGECETLATLVESARQRATRWPAYLNRDHCQDAAGTKYTILTSFGLSTSIYLFRADTGELVSSIWMDDVPICSNEAGATSHVDVTGALIPECTWADDDATAFCSDVDEPNVHALETCIYRFMPEPTYAPPAPIPAPDGGLLRGPMPTIHPGAAAPDTGAR